MRGDVAKSWDFVKRLSVETAVFVVFLFLFFMVMVSPAKADTAVVVANCGTPPATYAAGQNRPTTQNEDGEQCVETTGTITPSGTQDVNVTEIGDSAVVVGTNGLDTTGAGLLSVNLTAQRDGTAPPNCTENQFCNLRMTGNRGLYTAIIPSPFASSAIVPDVTSAAASNLVVSAAAANLVGFQVTTGASAGYVMVFNATALPSDGAVTPTKCYAVAANDTIGVDFRPGPWPRFSTGITIGFSTTGCFTLTASATAFISAEAS